MSPPLCSRCGEAPAKVWMQSSGRCISCFQFYMHRSFKTNVGRAGAGGRPTGLALAVSGGPSSASMALLMSNYLKSLVPNPHAPPARLVLLHVTADGVEPPVSIDAMRRRIPEAEYHHATIDAHVVDDLRHVKDSSDRSVLARSVVQNSIFAAAKDIGCDKALLGTNANRTAVDIIDRTVSGTGASVHEVGATSFRTSRGVTVIRPLRDIPARLLVRYAQIQFPDTSFSPYSALGAMGNGLYRKGLYDVIERFVEETGEDNQSSVHNVVRTAARLLRNDAEYPCEFCGQPDMKGEISGASKMNGCGGSCSCGKQSNLCSSCFAAIDRAAVVGDDGINSVEQLISRSREFQQRQQRMETMRQAIEEFIL